MLFRSIAGRGSANDRWKELDLWRSFPANDFDFWLSVAWELRRRNWEYPTFMAGITDLRLIEPEMKRWELEKAIQEWNGRFQQFEARPQGSEPGALELRLTLGAERAYLEGRSQPEEAFSELKPGQAHAMATQFEQGVVEIGRAHV